MLDYKALATFRNPSLPQKQGLASGSQGISDRRPLLQCDSDFRPHATIIRCPERASGIISYTSH